MPLTSQMKPQPKPNPEPLPEAETDNIQSSFIRQANKQSPKISLGLVGATGSGKTTVCGTFPNVQFWDFDNNFPTEMVAKGVNRVPIYDPLFREEMIGHLGIKQPAMKPKAIEHSNIFLIYLIAKLRHTYTLDQTVVIDSFTALSDQVMRYVAKEYKDKIAANEFARWMLYAQELETLFDLFKMLNCNFICIFHEDQIRDNETNRLLARKWIIDGKKFSGRVPMYFNNLFRQVRINKSDTGKPSIKKESVDMDKTVEYDYVWQIKQGDQFDDARTTMKTDKMFVPAHYQSFLDNQ